MAATDAISEGSDFARMMLLLLGLRLEIKALKMELAEVKAKLQAPDHAA